MGKKSVDQQTNGPGDFLSKTKWLWFLVISVMITLVAFSCGPPENQTKANRPENENSLRYDVIAPFNDLNPNSTIMSGSSLIFPLLYSYLFVPDAKGELQPDLARAWSHDEKKRVWTIQLKKTAKFHDNRPVTAKDVKYAIERRIEKRNPDLNIIIDQIDILSPAAIAIRLKRGDPSILHKIWDFEIVPHEDGGRIDYYNNPVGSGPFRFKQSDGKNRVVLEANEDFYNGRPSLDQVVFFFQPRREKTWTRLLSGETDIAQEISPKNLEMLGPLQDRFYIDQYILNFYTILLYNTFDPLFSDPRVRMALTLAIDRERIVKNILMGKGIVANGPMGVNSPYHNPDITPLPYDIKKSQSLLRKAGWIYKRDDKCLVKDGKPFDFTIFLFKESQVEKKVAKYIQLCLHGIGIKANLRILDHNELKAKYARNTDFQAVLTELNATSRNPGMIKILWSTDDKKQASGGGFYHPDVTRLIQKALSEKDPDRQMSLFHEIDALIVSLQPGTFLFQKSAIDVMSKRFDLRFPFNLDHQGIYRLRFASLASR